jgi:hypothetical protein
MASRLPWARRKHEGNPEPGGGREQLLMETFGEIIESRLLLLQSKRLMLSACEKRLGAEGGQKLRRRVERLRAETDMAQHAYRSSILAWGSPKSSEYWLIAYSRLIAMGNALVDKMRSETVDLPAGERYQISADVEMLEDIVGDWTERMRKTMAEAVA